MTSPKSGPESLFSNLLTALHHPKMTSGMEPNMKVGTKKKNKRREKPQRKKELRSKDDLGQDQLLVSGQEV